MNTNQKSICCNADIIISGTGDFDDNDKIETFYHICSNCRKACDTK